MTHLDTSAVDALSDDGVQPFQIETGSLRGRMVRLGAVLDQLLSAHAYPDPVAAQVGELVTLACLLASTLKYDGVFTLQIKGDGPIPLAVADVTGSGGIRTYARYDKAAVAARAGEMVSDLFGKGYIAFTVDQGDHTQRYQGIVELSGETLTLCLADYFRMSEQVQAGLTTAVRKGDAGGWRAGGIMLQHIPTEGGLEGEGAGTLGDLAEEKADDWNRAMVLLETATKDEITSRTLAPADLLFRLFHEDGVRIYDAQPLGKRCSCVGDRLMQTLRSLPKEELREIYDETGRLELTCEFCNKAFQMKDEEVAELIGVP